MLRCSLLMVSAAILLGVGSALAQALRGDCVRDASSVVCDVRPSRPGEIQNVTASVNGEPVAVSYKAFEATGGTAAWYFLLQANANPKDSAQTVDRIVREGQKIGDTRRVFAIGTFGETLEERESFTATPQQIAALKDPKTFKPGERVALFVAAGKAIDKLMAPDMKADRKALVIFSDGRSFWNEGREQVIKKAIDNNILVYTVFMSIRPNANKDLLDKLKEEVGGVFFAAIPCGVKSRKAGLCDDIELDEAAIRDFLLYLERGGSVRFASSALPENAELILKAEQEGAQIQSKPILGSAIPLSPNNNDAADVWTFAADWTRRNPAIAISAGVLALLLIAVGLLTTLRARSKATSAQAPAASKSALNVGSGHDAIVISAALSEVSPGQVYGWLEFVDAELRRVPLSSTNVRIGRHKDNDIILQNRTVHRRHAVLAMSPSRSFSINDLGGANGTCVNGERCLRRDLEDGDLIELGEVRLRFYSA